MGGAGRAAHSWLLSLHAWRRPMARARRAISEKPRHRPDAYSQCMITNVSLVTVWVTDQDEAKAFYTDKLGFEATADITMGDREPSQPPGVTAHAGQARSTTRRRGRRCRAPHAWQGFPERGRPGN